MSLGGEACDMSLPDSLIAIRKKKGTLEACWKNRDQKS